MKLGINILFLEPGKVGGSEIFAREILKRMDVGIASRISVYLYCTQTFAKTAKYKNIHVEPLIKNASNKIFRLLFEIFVLPIFAKKDNLNLLLSAGYTSPIVTHCKKAVIIFDTQFISMPHTVSLLNRLVYKIFMPLVVKVNDTIVTTSNFSKSEIERGLSVPTEKIKVVYGAVDKKVFKQIPNIKKKDYIMTLAATHPHKNVDVLINAFKILSEKKKFRRLRLYITGFPSSGHKKVLEEIKDYKLGGSVKFLGWIKREKLAKLLAEARVFVFPSSYEGFGLPPLEAMAVGTPVISSQKGSLKEVIGNACLKLRNEKDPEEIAWKLEKVINDLDLQKKLIKKGEARVNFFDWDESYQKLLGALGL